MGRMTNTIFFIALFNHTVWSCKCVLGMKEKFLGVSGGKMKTVQKRKRRKTGKIK